MDLTRLDDYLHELSTHIYARIAEVIMIVNQCEPRLNELNTKLEKLSSATRLV